MSLSELYRLAKGKHKSAQQSAGNCFIEPHSPPRSDFVELVWENGPVVMQGQSNRARKTTCGNVRVHDLPQDSRFRDKGLVKGDDTEMGLGKIGMMESAMNEFHITVPSESDEHDNMVPWLRYHMDEDEHVQNNFSSDFYTELSDVSAHNLLKDTNNITTAERRGDSVRAIKDSHPIPGQNPMGFGQHNVETIRPKMTLLDQLSSHQSLCSFPSFRSKVSDAHLIYDSAQRNCSSSMSPRMKMQTEDIGRKLSSSTIMNFSHFSKHASMVNPTVDTISTKAGPEMSVGKQLKGKEIESVLTGAKPVVPLQVASISGQQRDSGYHTQLKVSSKEDGSKLSSLKPLELLLSANHSGPVSCQINDVPLKQAIVPNGNGNTATGNVENSTEPVVASSVCSGNSGDRASNDITHGLKRKCGKYEDSEYRSEDIEEESVGIRKAAANRAGSGSKRSRAAEVHNLSERRRRDRINEKMRALQELIPNCNKVDKASMLDEAIEYLKTLQLQLQMMSMGPGLCMPSMMLPHAAHMPRFSPMSVGVGMGMGMGYGLSMLNMNGNPSNYQMVQMPSVPGTRFPMLPAPFPNQPMYGYQGQGIGIPISCPPATTYAAGPPSRPVMDLNSTSSMLPVGNLDLVQTSQDMVQNVTMEDMPKTNDNFNHGSVHHQAANDVHLFPASKAPESSTKVDRLPVRERCNER